MANDDNAARKPAIPSTGSSTAAQQYLAKIYPYTEIVLQISDNLLDISLLELATNLKKLQNYEIQIADVIRNLEKLDRAPAGGKFNKQTVLGTLKKAREELGMALFLLNTSDPEKAAKGIKNLTTCRDYLNLALRHMPSK